MALKVSKSLTFWLSSYIDGSLSLFFKCAMPFSISLTLQILSLYFEAYASGKSCHTVLLIKHCHQVVIAPLKWFGGLQSLPIHHHLSSWRNIFFFSVKCLSIFFSICFQVMIVATFYLSYFFFVYILHQHFWNFYPFSLIFWGKIFIFLW